MIPPTFRDKTPGWNGTDFAKNEIEGYTLLRRNEGETAHAIRVRGGDTAEQRF